MATDVQSPAAPPFDCDVVVVGAGPIGLTTAGALRHHGVACRVIERRPAPRDSSRANNVWSRPQELLETVGLRERIAERAYAVRTTKVLQDGRPLDRVRLDDVASPHPAALYTGQDVIESTLIDALADRGTTVERRRTLRSLAQDDDGVQLTVSDADDPGGALEQIRCRYVVGADGSSGTVAAALGLDVPAEAFEGRATRQIDARLRWRRSTDPDQLWFFLYHHGFAGVMPIWGDRHRLFFLEDDAEVPERDPTLEEMQARAREVIGDGTIELSDPVWTSWGRFEHGVASRYAVGRVLLAGDAGHKTLPIGGQGMNAGIHDAVGAAWRLAMVLGGDATTALLDSYDTERRGAHADLDAQQATGFKRLMYRGRLADAALGVAAGALPDIGSRMFGGEDLQQLSVAYPGSPLSREELHRRGPGGVGGPVAGDRAPDARVVLDTGETTTVHAQLRATDGPTWSWTLLAFDGRDAGAHPELSDALGTLTAGRRWIRPRLVLADPPAPGTPAGATLFDLDGAAHAAFGLDGTPALVLVRPDGHLAYRGRAGDRDALRDHLASVTA